MVNVKPSAEGLSSWNWKSVVNEPIFTGVVNHADPLSVADPNNVISSAPLVTVAAWLSARPAEELNPLGKLTGVFPPTTYFAVTTALGDDPLATAMALMVVVPVPTVIGPE